MKYPEELGDVKHWDIETKPLLLPQGSTSKAWRSPPLDFHDLRKLHEGSQKKSFVRQFTPEKRVDELG